MYANSGNADSKRNILGTIINNNNRKNGNFICVFECTIVNLATYRQFANAALHWIIQKTKRKRKGKKEKRKEKKSKLHKLH